MKYKLTPQQLLDYCIDWNGEPMVDGEEPRIIPNVGNLRYLANRIQALEEQVSNLSWSYEQWRNEHQERIDW